FFSISSPSFFFVVLPSLLRSYFFSYTTLFRSGVCVLKYKILLPLLFLCFIIVGACCLLNIKHLSQNVSFYAVGDNLIHPAVYHDASVNNGSFDFKPMYSHLKKILKLRI